MTELEKWITKRKILGDYGNLVYDIDIETSTLRDIRLKKGYEYTVKTVEIPPVESIEIGTLLRNGYRNDIEYIDVPDSVKYIGDHSFDSWLGLKSLSISKNVEYIGLSAFANCENLESVEFRGNIPEICGSSFINTPFLIEKIKDRDWFVGNTLIRPKDDIVNADYGDDVIFSKGCFAGHKSIEKVKIPRNMNKILEVCFYGCSNLHKIEIPDTVEVICEAAFQGCENIVNVVLPDSIKIIGDSAFNRCSNLKTLNIPDGVEYILSEAFAYTDLRKIVIPKSVKFISYDAFEGIRKYVESILIPKETLIIEYDYSEIDSETNLEKLKQSGVRSHLEWFPAYNGEFPEHILKYY